VNGAMMVLRLLPETKQQAVDFAAGKLWFSCKDYNGAPLTNCVEAQGLNLPASSTSTFEIKDLVGSLEPGESVPYWRYVHLDADASTIEVYTTIAKPGNPKDRPWDFDSVFNLDRGQTSDGQTDDQRGVPVGRRHRSP